MNVNMFGLRFTIDIHARSKNGHPAQNTTGVDSTSPIQLTSGPVRHPAARTMSAIASTNTGAPRRPPSRIAASCRPAPDSARRPARWYAARAPFRRSGRARAVQQSPGASGRCIPSSCAAPSRCRARGPSRISDRVPDDLANLRIYRAREHRAGRRDRGFVHGQKGGRILSKALETTRMAEEVSSHAARARMSRPPRLPRLSCRTQGRDPSYRLLRLNQHCSSSCCSIHPVPG